MLKLRTCLLLLACLLAAACSGGGGSDSGEEVDGSPNVWLDVRPTDLDTGDRIVVTMGLTGVHEDGIELKLRYPRQFSFVEGTARVLIDGNAISIEPDLNLSAAYGDDSFLLFFLRPALMRIEEQEGRAEVVVELRANEELDGGEVSVDADITSGDFDPNQPEFTSQDTAWVTIQRDD